MKKFILGMVTMAVIVRNHETIVKVLEDTIAKLELKRDMLLHDNPDLEK